MKKMNMKKVVLLGSIVALVLLVLLGVGEAKFGLACSYETGEKGSYFGGYISGSNGETYPDIVYFKKAEWCEPLASTLLPLFPIFIFSLITYKMRDQVFRAWWNFVRWWVPVIIVATLLLNSANSGGGMGIGGAVSGAFDILFLLILYAVLVATSLVKIVREYNKK
jgi:hypothetical protein